MTTAPRLITPEKRGEDVDQTLRPQTLDEFVGQAGGARQSQGLHRGGEGRGEALDHVLFVGPPGLGKTTLAQIMARELGVNFRSTSGPVIAKAGDLAALLTNLEDRDVLFIDEIHRLNPAVEEILYPAMEDYQLDLIIGEGPAARSVKIDLARFTLVGGDDARSACSPIRCATVSAFRCGSISTRSRSWSRSCGAARASSACRWRRRRDRDRAAGARHAAHRRPAAAPRARFRHGRQAPTCRPQDRRRGAVAAGGGRARPRPARPALSHHDRATISAAARSASRPSPPACRSRATPSRTSSSPI
jgi:hypothetical protein